VGHADQAGSVSGGHRSRYCDEKSDMNTHNPTATNPKPAEKLKSALKPNGQIEKHAEHDGKIETSSSAIGLRMPVAQNAMNATMRIEMHRHFPHGRF
jgi:hypothetical protein